MARAEGQGTPRGATARTLAVRLRSRLPYLREKYAVRSLELFGSWVRGEATEDSDLDVLVEFDAVPTLLEFLELEAHLSEMLAVPVDLVMKEALKEAIGQRILREAIAV